MKKNAVREGQHPVPAPSKKTLRIITFDETTEEFTPDGELWLKGVLSHSGNGTTGEPEEPDAPHRR